LDETAYILNMADTDALFFAAEFAATVRELQRRCPRLKEIICIDAHASGHASSLDAWLAGVPDAFIAVEVPGDSIATLSSTGGTTGKPKGVVATHRVWAYRIAETLLRVRIDHPVNLVAAPMTHAAGAGALELMVMGATHVILPRFDPELVVNAIGERGVTHLFLPRPQSIACSPILACGAAIIRRCVTSPTPPPHVAGAAQRGHGGLRPGDVSGLRRNRARHQRLLVPPEEHAKALASGDDTRLASCGYPSPLARIEIVDDAGQVLAAGRGRRNCGAQLLQRRRYYNNEQETRHSFVDGWFHTGDLGLKDAAGRVHITDRKKEHD